MAPANILLTGGNRGIGLSIVKKILEDQDVKRVFATARKPEEAKELNAITDPRLKVIQMEVTCDDSIQKAYEQIKTIVGEEGLNCLINNAGILVPYPVNLENRADLIRQLDVNTVSPIVITQIFYPLLLKAAARNSSGGLSTSRASVINISSTGGSITLNDWKKMPKEYEMMKQPIFLAYKASKSALNSAMREISNLYEPEGILVVNFCPGWVQTDLGGEKAILTLDDSMKQLVPAILSRTGEHNGLFFSYNGDPLPF